MTLGEIIPNAVHDMISGGLRAVRELASAEVALIAECCTASTLIKRREFEEKMIKDFE